MEALAPHETTEVPPDRAASAHEIREVAEAVLSWFDRNRRWLFLVVLVLYIAAFTGRWRINPDSAIYMSLLPYVATQV
jgi:hypothetical protein